MTQIENPGAAGAAHGAKDDDGKHRLNGPSSSKSQPKPDRDQIATYFGTLFKHASTGSWVSLRTFYEANTDTFDITPVKLNGDLNVVIDAAYDAACKAEGAKAKVVFCPPVATFTIAEHARQQDIHDGLDLAVELDNDPQASLEKLERLLGPATLVVESGGVTADGAPKLHAHWRLAKPAQGKDALALLKEARILACALVGGDPTHAPISHPIRCPGSVHRKGEPKLCTIRECRPDVEIDLSDALAKLKTVTSPKQKSEASGQGTSDYDELFEQVLTGTNFHQSLVRLAAKFIGKGHPEDEVVGMLQALMNSVPGPHDERWQARYDQIPQSVASAMEKFGDDEAPSAGLDEWDAGDDTDPIPPRGWLYGNVFCRCFASSLIGDGGGGKTALRIAQALSLATGRMLTGEHVFQRCRVLIVCFEDDRDELRRRVKAAMMHYKISPSEVKGWLFLSAPGLKAGKLLTVGPKGNAVAGGLEKSLRDAITRRRIDLVILDPFVKTHGIEENTNSLMDEVVQILTGLATELNIAVDFPHHTSKGRAAVPGDPDRGRGATAVKDAARLVYTLTTMSTDEADTFGVAEAERRLHFRIDPGKVNITPPAREALWFKLVGVSLGNKTELYPSGDNVQTVQPWTPPETFEGISNDEIGRILGELDAGLPDGNRFSDAPNAGERAAWKVVHKHLPEKNEKQCRGVINAWIKSGVLTAFDYKNPATRKTVKGLKVDQTKRPDVF